MARIKLKYNKNPHQKLFHEDTTSKRLHLSTGFGGGKTHALIMKMLKLKWLNRHLSGGLMCPTYADFKKDVLPLAEEIFYENKIPYRYNGQDHTFIFPWARGKVYVVSAEKKIRGPNWAFACVNELTLCPLVRYKEVLGRVRVKTASCPQVASVGTPEGWDSDYYEYMIENPRENFRIIYGDTRDNLKNLQESYVEDLMQDYDSIMQQAYIEGQWVSMTGNSFYYSYNPKVNDDNSIKQRDHAAIHVSLDFNVDPMCATLWNFDGKTATAFDQIKIPGKEGGAKTKNMCDRLKSIDEPYNFIIYPDPAGKNRRTDGKPDIEVLKSEGFENIRTKPKAPGMRERQLHHNNLLEKGVIKLHPQKCKGLKKDYTAVQQNVITLEKEKKNPELTHFSDGADYMFDILIPFKSKRSNSRVEQWR